MTNDWVQRRRQCFALLSIIACLFVSRETIFISSTEDQGAARLNVTKVELPGGGGAIRGSSSSMHEKSSSSGSSGSNIPTKTHLEDIVHPIHHEQRSTNNKHETGPTPSPDNDDDGKAPTIHSGTTTATTTTTTPSVPADRPKEDWETQLVGSIKHESVSHEPEKSKTQQHTEDSLPETIQTNRTQLNTTSALQTENNSTQKNTESLLQTTETTTTQTNQTDVETNTTIDWDAIPCPGNTEPWHSCNLTDFYFGYPVLLISFGRSGSSVTWDTMVSLTSPRRAQKAAESTGSNSDQSLQLLENLDPNEHGKCWMQRILCTHQEENRVLTKQARGKSKIIGTKYKPYLPAFNHTKAREALQWIAASPYIKVVYNERDPLDITISRHKHKAFNVPAHCYGDGCKEEHVSHRKDLVLPMDFLWQSMTNLTEETAIVKGILDELHVDRVEVSYERLYYASHANEWMKIFAHLGVGPSTNLTKADVFANIAHTETHPISRWDAIANYDEVEAALNGTKFEKYLTPVSVAAELDSWRRTRRRRLSGSFD